MKSLDFLTESLEKYFVNGHASFGGYLLQSNRLASIFGVVYRKLTSQKFRLLLQERKFLDSRIPYFSKLHGIDYLNFLVKKRPLIPYLFFPKRDRLEINYFLRIMLLSAFVEGFSQNDFEGRWEEFEKIRKEVGVELKLNPFSGVFTLYGFKSIVYPDTGVFPDNLRLNIFDKSDDKVCLDLGAFIGDSAFVISNFFKSSLVYAFEPDSKNLEILKRNIILNNLQGRVFPVSSGVGLENGWFSLKIGGEGSKILVKGSKGDVKVRVVSIDSFVRDKKIEKVDFIKMDIEGSEFDALKGAVKTLKRDKPDLLIAIYHKGEHFFEIPGWLKKQVPEYNLRFVAMNGASPIIERYIAASVRKI